MARVNGPVGETLNRLQGSLPIVNEMAAVQAQEGATDSQAVKYGGSTWEQTHGDLLGQQVDPVTHVDQRNYMYGRDPLAAQAAVDQANAVGNQALGVGTKILTEDTRLAADARGRAAPVGDFGQQNAALGSSMGYGGQLAGLEATQGASGAQAQLQAGTNQAMAQQLAMARSGRGFGGNAAAMGQAQGNMAGISANNANQSAMLSAQENAAWRGRQAANYGNAAAIAQGAGAQYGQQAATDINAYLQNQGQNDAASLGYLGQGATAYGQGTAGSFAGQGLANTVRGMEQQGGQGLDDRMLRAWAARSGFDLQEKAADAQQTAAMIQGGATIGGALIGSFGGPAGTAVGGAAGNAAGKALT